MSSSVPPVNVYGTWYTTSIVSLFSTDVGTRRAFPVETMPVGRSVSNCQPPTSMIRPVWEIRWRIEYTRMHVSGIVMYCKSVTRVIDSVTRLGR